MHFDTTVICKDIRLYEYFHKSKLKIENLSYTFYTYLNIMCFHRALREQYLAHLVLEVITSILIPYAYNWRTMFYVIMICNPRLAMACLEGIARAVLNICQCMRWRQKKYVKITTNRTSRILIKYWIFNNHN